MKLAETLLYLQKNNSQLVFGLNMLLLKITSNCCEKINNYGFNLNEIINPMVLLI